MNRYSDAPGNEFYPKKTIEDRVSSESSENDEFIETLINIGVRTHSHLLHRQVSRTCLLSIVYDDISVIGNGEKKPDESPFPQRIT